MAIAFIRPEWSVGAACRLPVPRTVVARGIFAHTIACTAVALGATLAVLALSIPRAGFSPEAPVAGVVLGVLGGMLPGVTATLVASRLEAREVTSAAAWATVVAAVLSAAAFVFPLAGWLGAIVGCGALAAVGVHVVRIR